MELEVKPTGGESIMTVCVIMCRLASILEITIWCTHNGTMLYATKNSTPESVFEQWEYRTKETK